MLKAALIHTQVNASKANRYVHTDNGNAICPPLKMEVAEKHAVYPFTIRVSE